MRYFLRCQSCDYRKSGQVADFANLIKVDGCRSCSGVKYKCPVCGYAIKALKVREPNK